MGDPKNLSLQAGYLVCANNLRREAKLCDIILYVQGRMGAMVGYPAHKLLLISASKYFKLLFEREDLRNYCHFPHLSEEGVFAVLDIIYGREIREETNLDDALMAARFLQVDCAVDTLELKKEEAAQAAARASPEPKRSSSVSSDQIVKKRKTQDNTYKTHNLPPTQSPSHAPADVKLFRNSSLKSPESSGMSRTQEMSESQDSPFSQTEHSAGGYQDSSSLDHDPSTPQDDDNNMTAIVKMEPDVDLTADDSEHGLLSQGYGQQQDHDNLTFSGHSFGAMNTDNSQQDGTSNMYGMSDYGGQGSYQGGQGGNASGMYYSAYRRRCRTTFTEKQLNIMKEHFKFDPNPHGFHLVKLTQDTGLDRRVVQVWFQNMRSKQKRSQSVSSAHLYQPILSNAGQEKYRQHTSAASPVTHMASPSSSQSSAEIVTMTIDSQLTSGNKKVSRTLP